MAINDKKAAVATLVLRARVEGGDFRLPLKWIRFPINNANGHHLKIIHAFTMDFYENPDSSHSNISYLGCYGGEGGRPDLPDQPRIACSGRDDDNMS